MTSQYLHGVHINVVVNFAMTLICQKRTSRLSLLLLYFTQALSLRYTSLKLIMPENFHGCRDSRYVFQDKPRIRHRSFSKRNSS
jgi:hypothetical protein